MKTNTDVLTSTQILRILASQLCSSVPSVVTPSPFDFTWNNAISHTLTDRVLFAIASPALPVSPRTLLLTILAAGSLAGAFIGTFALDEPARLLGVLYTSLKVPLLILLTAAITLPGFFVISTILRLRDDWPIVLRAILRGQAALCCTLAALAPITTFLYISGLSYRFALLWNTFVFLIAALVAQLIMRRAYAPLIARNRRHRATLLLWTTLYAFVGIQMAWTLRPFIGAPHVTPTFFRDEPLSNAYIVVLRLIVP